MKLTKTEQVLLARARQNGGRGSVTIGYRTGTKRGLWGGRESSALVCLVKKGLATVVQQTSWVDSCSAYSDHVTDTTFVLTVEDSNGQV